MKKLLSIIASLTVCTVLTACSNTINNIGENESRVIEKRSLEGLQIVKSVDYLDYTVDRVKTFEDLESFSSLIVIGEFTDNSSVCFRGTYFDDAHQKEVEFQVVSSCPMKITKVLAGDAHVGDVVNVLQEEHISNGSFISRSKLTPMQMGDEWLFCLEYCADKRSDGNSYWCVGDSKGRYSTKNIGSNEIMCFSDSPELGVYNEDDFQEEFYNALLEKYGDF